MSHCVCAESTEGCGFDLEMFFIKFCCQGKSFNSVPQMVVGLYNTSLRGAVHPACTFEVLISLVKISLSLEIYRYVFH